MSHRTLDSTSMRLPLGLISGALVLLCCWLERLPAVAEETAEAPQVAELVVRLDDDLYDTRENAQQQLFLLGLPALEAVAETARSGSLESSTRALNILLSWSESNDHVLQVAALEKIVTLPNRPREVRLASELLADARERAALEAIVALGGSHNLDQWKQPNLQNGQKLPPQVVIGSNWKGGIEGLHHLAALTTVRRAVTLSFHSAPIDDSALEVIEKLPNFRRIEFYGTTISDHAFLELKKKLEPRGTLVAKNNGALLGIQGMPGGGGARIQAVFENSAADKAGLQENDVITELEGETIRDFTTLTDRIARYKPGDSVELTIIRNQQVQKVTVTFDRWGNYKPKLRGTKTDAQRPNETQPRQIKLNRR